MLTAAGGGDDDPAAGRAEHTGPAGGRGHLVAVTMCSIGTWAAFTLDSTVT